MQLKRNQISIIMILVCFGLLGPVYFIAQGLATPAASPTPTPQAVPSAAPSGPVTLTQVLEYEGSVTANIVSVSPMLIAVVASSLNQSDLNATLSNAPNAALYSLQGSGLYTAAFVMQNVSDYPGVLSWLSAENITVIDHGLPAEIELPASFTVSRGGIDTTMSMGPGDSVDAVVHGNITSGPSVFSLKVVKSGSTKKITAIEAS
jgi:hypothetical protein